MTQVLYHPNLSFQEIVFLSIFPDAIYNSDTVSEIQGWTPITPELVQYGLNEELIRGNSYGNGSEGGDANVVLFKSPDSEDLVVAFRSADGDGYLAANPRSNYDKLVSDFSVALDRYIAAKNPSKVSVVGHSLGAVFSTIYMEDHPGDRFAAVTFGSPIPGWSPNDTRILNIGHDNDLVYGIRDGSLSPANSTTNLYSFIGSGRGLEGLLEPHAVRQYQYTINQIYESEFYQKIERENFVIIDRTDEIKNSSDFSGQNVVLPGQNLFFLGEDNYDDVFLFGLGNNYLEGLGGNDTFIINNNSLSEEVSNSFLSGGEGNDRFEGGSFAVETAIFTGNFEDYDISNSEDGVTIVITHARGTQVDGIDTLKNIEFAQFADRKVPLPLRDGPAQTVSNPILDAEQEVGSVSLTLPTYMYDRDVDYTLNISANAATGRVRVTSLRGKKVITGC